MSPESLIQTYGYPILFIGAILEGESFVLVAGSLAQNNYLELKWVILTAFSGSFVGDQFFFFLGRYRGVPFLEKYPSWKEKIGKARCIFEKYRILTIIGFRFMYGLRSVSPFVIGMSGFCPGQFVVLNILGAMIWSLTMVSIGCGLVRMIRFF